MASPHRPVADRHLTFGEKAILKWYPQQPLALRSIAFLVLLFVTAYGILHSIGGTFVISGQVAEKTTGSVIAAKAFDVHLPRTSQNYYGTNHQGFYSAVMSPTEYAKLLLTGSVTAALVDVKGGREYPEQAVRFGRLSQAFDRIVIDPSMNSPAAVHSQSLRPTESPLFGTVFAAENTISTRIVISELYLNPKATTAQQGVLKLKANGQTFNVFTAMGTSARSIPLIPGELFSYGLDYYFEIPRSLTNDISGEVSLEIKQGGFLQFLLSPYTESFPLKIPAQAVGALPLSGDSGSSRMKLIVCTPYPIALYDKEDLAGIRSALVKSLIDAGYWLKVRPSQVGAAAETNAIYFGKAVPYTTAQKVLGLVLSSGVALKWVEYALPLKDPFEIQIGSWTACQRNTPLDARRLERLASAGSEDEFKKEIASIPNCAQKSQQAPQKHSQ